MAHSLYRKWRPQTFDGLKGQDAIRDTLLYALKHGQLSQAYLFCGPRGTGKTTTARLIAKFVNCDTEESKPCNTCATCQSIVDGNNLDIIEIDAASNRGIDEIRQLRESVRFAPTQAKHKVFIIDEVHMLTREAFNALLKTLEEPPAQTIFILATTEAHKIPATIISRCQRYDFRLATPDTLVTHLLEVAKQEEIPLTKDGAVFIARLGEGSFRDSLSLLDQVRSSDHKEYNQAVIEEIFGYIPQQQVSDCLMAILAGQIAPAHAAVDGVVARGGDLRAFCDQLLQLSQSCLEGLAMGDLGRLDEGLGGQCQKTGITGMVTWIELLLSAVNQMKQSPIIRLPLDIAISKYGAEQGRSQIAVQQVRQLEPIAVKPVPSPSVTIPAIVAKSHVSQKVESTEDEPVVHETVTVPVAVALPDVVHTEDWQKILLNVKQEAPSLLTTLAQARVMSLENDVLKIAVRFKMHADKINQVKNRTVIETAVGQVLQAPLKIEAQVVKDMPSEETDAVDLADVFDFED